MRFLTAVLLVCLPALALAGWTVSPFSETIMMDINMVTDKIGFIAGAENGSGANALKTTDGGNTWNELPIAPAFMLMASAAYSETSAVIGGVSILTGSAQYTVDGQTFTNSSEKHVAMSQVMSAYTVGGSFNEGYALVGNWQIYGDNATYNGVSLSSNGGKSFSIIDTQNPVPARYGAFPSPSVFFLTFGTWPNTSAQTFGRPITRNIHYHTFGMNNVSQHHIHKHKPSTPEDQGQWIAQIMRTTDGGNTWELQFSNGTFYFNQIACPSTTVCFAVGENDNFGFVFRTTDGETWEQIYQVEGVSLMSVEAISESEIWVGGGVLGFPVVGHTYHSIDGGNTFQAGTIADNYISSFSFPDSTHGFAVSINTEQQSGVLQYTA